MKLSESYDDLIAYLTSYCTTDIEKVRSVFIWMNNQEITFKKLKGAKTVDTPRGFMKLMSERKASYASFFAILCR